MRLGSHLLLFLCLFSFLVLHFLCASLRFHFSPLYSVLGHDMRMTNIQHFSSSEFGNTLLHPSTSTFHLHNYTMPLEL